MEHVPTKEECLEQFWDAVARAEANARRREAAKVARQADTQRSAQREAKPLEPAGTS